MRFDLRFMIYDLQRQRGLLCLIVLLISSFLLLGCDVRSVDPVVKIGLVAPFEGEQRQIGYDIIYSARLAVREVNAAGGINGVRVALVAYDDSTYPEEAERVAQALVVDEGIVAVVGHWTEATNAAVEGSLPSAEAVPSTTGWREVASSLPNSTPH